MRTMAHQDLELIRNVIAQLDLKDLTAVRKVTLNQINLLIIRLLEKNIFLIIVILLIHSVTVCDGSPCRNSAVCVDNDDGTFTCKCQPNYEGILCEKKGKIRKEEYDSIIYLREHCTPAVGLE